MDYYNVDDNGTQTVNHDGERQCNENNVLMNENNHRLAESTCELP
jgi:hypothetical protein